MRGAVSFVNVFPSPPNTGGPSFLLDSRSPPPSFSTIARSRPNAIRRGDCNPLFGPTPVWCQPFFLRPLMSSGLFSFFPDRKVLALSSLCSHLAKCRFPSHLPSLDPLSRFPICLSLCVLEGILLVQNDTRYCRPQTKLHPSPPLSRYRESGPLFLPPLGISNPSLLFPFLSPAYELGHWAVFVPLPCALWVSTSSPSGK